MSRRTTSTATDSDRRLPRWVVPAVVVFWLGFLGAIAPAVLLGPAARAVRAAGHLGLPGPRRRARRQPAGPAGLAAGDGDGADPVRRHRPVPALRGRHRDARRRRRSPTSSRTPSSTSPTPSRRSTTPSAPTSTPSSIIKDFNDPNGTVQQFIKDQQANAINLSVTALGVLLQLFSVLLFTFYLVADGPKLRRGAVQPAHAGRARSGCCARGSWPATRPAATCTRGRCWR